MYTPCDIGERSSILMRFVNLRVNVPWLGSEIDPATGEEKSTRNWSRFHFKGEVDRRRVKREVRKGMFKILERKIRTDELLLAVRTRRLTHDGLDPVDAFANRFGEEKAPDEAIGLMPSMFGPGGDGGVRSGPRSSDGPGAGSPTSELQPHGGQDSELSAQSAGVPLHAFPGSLSQECCLAVESGAIAGTTSDA
jgi:hypothetical protein